MADIVVDTYKLRQYAERISAVNGRLSRLDRRLDSLYWRVGLLGLWNLMQADALTCYSWRLVRCQSYLQQTAHNFECAENLLQGLDPKKFKGVSVSDFIKAYDTTLSGDIDGKDITDRLEKLIPKVKPYAINSILSIVSPVTSLLYITSGVAYGNTPTIKDPTRKPSSTRKREWLGYEVNDDKTGVERWITKSTIEGQNEWGYAGINAYFGKAEADYDLNFSFMKHTHEKEMETIDSKWDDEVTTEFIVAEIGAGVSAFLLGFDAEAGVGTDMLGAEVEGEASVGNVDVGAEGKFSITEDGVNAVAEGKAMVSAVEGEASGTINILGLEIKGTIGGYAGAVGAEGKIGIEDNKFVMEGGAAALLGVSGGIEIGFNDEGWDNFVDFVTFWD